LALEEAHNSVISSAAPPAGGLSSESLILLEVFLVVVVVVAALLVEIDSQRKACAPPNIRIASAINPCECKITTANEDNHGDVKSNDDAIVEYMSGSGNVFLRL